MEGRTPPCVPRQNLIHSERRPTYASAYTHKRHEQKWLVAGKANVTSKSIASEMTTECVSTECTEMPDGTAMEGDVFPDWKCTYLEVSARSLFTVESVASCAEVDCKFERRRQSHQLISLSNWLINETLLHRHLHLETATAPKRRR